MVIPAPSHDVRKLRLTEGRGTGIPKAMRAMQRNGSSPLRFDTDEGRTYFTATLPIHPGVRAEFTPEENTPEENTPEENTPSKPREAGGNTRAAVAARRLEVLRYCISPRDRASIQARFALKDADHMRLLYLTPLLRDGLLAMTDPEHPNAPTQKYKTTEKGQEYLQGQGPNTEQVTT